MWYKESDKKEKKVNFNKEANDELKEQSGNLTTHDRLVTFLYMLMRDYITPGDIQSILFNDIIDQPKEMELSNGWIGKYAEYVASKLK